MSAATFLGRLGMATLVFTLLAGLLMLVRRPVRGRLGAEATYALWLLVPLGPALCCWPAHRQVVPLQAATEPALGADLLPALPPMPATGLPLAAIVLCAWLLGAVAGALLLVRRQRGFVQSLGTLRRVDSDVWVSARSDAGPMLVGLLRPRIVLPADHAVRYSAEEQAAVLAHERMHRRRGDLWWNALCAALRCAFWFHPLAASAQRRYLADQELACDSAVLRSRAHAPQAYANALLKTQVGAGVPLGCAMQAASPVRERILNLGRRSSTRRVRALVALVLAGAAVAGGRVAWAASGEVVATDAAAPIGGAGYSVTMNVDIHGEHAAPRLLVRAGTPFAVAGEGGGTRWRVEFTLDRAPGRMVRLAGKISEDGTTIAAPVLVGRPGERVRVQVGDAVSVALVVQEQAG